MLANLLLSWMYAQDASTILIVQSKSKWAKIKYVINTIEIFFIFVKSDFFSAFLKSKWVSYWYKSKKTQNYSI